MLFNPELSMLDYHSSHPGYNCFAVTYSAHVFLPVCSAFSTAATTTTTSSCNICFATNTFWACASLHSFSVDFFSVFFVNLFSAYLCIRDCRAGVLRGTASRLVLCNLATSCKLENISQRAINKLRCDLFVFFPPIGA